MSGTLSFPTGIIGPGEAQIGLRANTQSGGRSPFTGTESTLVMPGARWEATLTYQLYAGLTGPSAGQAQVLSAFLSRLRGRAGRFTWSPTIAMPTRGVAPSVGGSAVINGANQTGDVLSTRGWPPNTANIFMPGDFLAWSDPTGRAQLHQVFGLTGGGASGVPSNASGICNVAISPSIRRSPNDGDPLNVGAPIGVFRLAEDGVRQKHLPGYVVQFTINIEEALV